MTLDADELEDDARTQTGLDDFGDGTHREGLERLVDAMNTEADLTEAGEVMQRMRLTTLLGARACAGRGHLPRHPAIAAEQVEGPVFVIGLPRTGTTALSQLVAADPQFRSLRVWESAAPCPPPEAATEHTDPRIAETEAGLAMMNEMFPLMSEHAPRGGDDADRVPGPDGHELPDRPLRRLRPRPRPTWTWVTECDMRDTYRYHRRVLRLLQWHCPPRLWHLKTPVHMFALDALLEAYPDAKFLWSHRDPAKVLGSVCSLIHYTRSWSSDRDDSAELGAEQLDRWWDGRRTGHGLPGPCR